MKDIIKKSLIYGGISVGSLGAGVGVSVGIILPKALQAKEALANFVSNGGPSANLQKALKEKGKLKVVALGDSITAGRNPYLGNEYYSYADFLVDGLRTSLGNIDKVEYRNYAKSGLKLAEYKSALENPNVARQLNDADIIPLTFGANDVLAVLEMFGLPYNIAQTLLANTGDILKSVDLITGKFLDEKQGSTKFSTEDERKALKPIDDAKETWNKFDWGLFIGSKPVNNLVRNANSNLTFSKKDAKDMFDNSIDTMIDISDGEHGRFFGLDKKFKNKIFDLVKREFATMIRDLHKAAPNAQIVVLGPALPFAQLPAEILFEKNKKANNKNLLQLFNDLLESMRDGAKTSLGKDNGFVDFYKMDELKYLAPYSWNLDNLDAKYDLYIKYKSDKEDLNTQLLKTTEEDKKTELIKKLKKLDKDFIKKTVNENSTKESVFKYVNYDTVDNYVKSVKDQPLSNIMDIHPTTYGQSLIGKSLFNIFAKKLGLKEVNINNGNLAIKAMPNDLAKVIKFEKVDQDDNIIKGGVSETRYKTAKAFNSLLTSWSQMPNGILKVIKDKLDEVKVNATPEQLVSGVNNLLIDLAFSLVSKTNSETNREDIADEFKKDLAKNVLADPIKKLSQLTKAYSLAKTNLNNDKVYSLKSVKWSIYGISSYFGFVQEIAKILKLAQTYNLIG